MQNEKNLLDAVPNIPFRLEGT
jgi:hypothetical protein